MATPQGRFPSRLVRSPVARSPITPFSSFSHKSVCLLDWWVVKPEGEGLVVSGFASTRSGEARLFDSARISKRLTATILEAVDGIRITLTGLINRSQAHRNGFSDSFCQLFQFGFPHDWEEYSTRGTSSKSAATGDLPKRDGFSELGASSSGTHTLLAHWNSLPVSQMHNFIMGLSEQSEDCLLDSILGELRQNLSQHTPKKANSPSTKRTRAATTRGEDGAPKSHTKATVDMNDIVDHRCSRGVMTRAMLKKLQEAQVGTRKQRFCSSVDPETSRKRVRYCTLNQQSSMHL